MSKASRMFRSRVNRSANLAALPVPAPVLAADPTAEADLSACLATLYDSSAGAFLAEAYAGTLPDVSRSEQDAASPEGSARLGLSTAPAVENPDSDDVLAILFQTIDSAAHHAHSSSPAVHAPAFPRTNPTPSAAPIRRTAPHRTFHR